MDGMNRWDRALLDRLFGPELPAEFLSECEAAKGVEWDGGDSEAAISNLLTNIIHTGIGSGSCMGWAMTRAAGGRHMLTIYRMKPMAEAA
jgi:hypothetical protein